MNLIRLSFAGLALLAALAAGCSRPPEPGPALRRVVFQTDWFAQAEHGGFYQALAKGYYREAGLDVEILTGGPGAGIKLKVAKGAADFGMNRGDDAILAVSRGLPLVMVMATLQHDPQALLLHADSPVRDFRDLDGRVVTAAVGMTWIPYIQQRYGIKFGLVPTTYGLASFLADRNVIQQCFLTSEPYFAGQKGVAVRVLPLTDTGYDMYHTVICRRELIRAEPAVVRAFVAASIRGWDDYVTGDPAPAHALILARNRDMTPGQLAYSRQALIDHALVTGRREKGEATGQLRLERIQEEIDRLREFGVLEKPLRADEVATRVFLPES
ncbi:MAG: ABC transporter substrate-binding protein [Opitutaceae bacterium]|nr:ABC transporter substrate-binding protein [Opitutaceae bacterium]